MSREQPKKILIVLLGAIGDVAQGVTLATRIKASWPEVHLAWAVEPPSEAIVRANRAIDQVIVFDRPRGPKAFLSFLREVRRERFCLVLDLQRHLKSGVTSWASRAPRRVGFHRTNAKEGNWLFNTGTIPPQENFSPKIAQYHAFGDLLGLERSEPLDHGLLLSDELCASAEESVRGAGCGEVSPEKRVALVIGARWESKRWPTTHFARLAVLLKKEFGFVSLLVGGGGGDRALAASIESEAARLGDSSAVCSLVDRTSLIELASVFSRVRFIIGNDSGPLHLASASKKPVISLFGATHPRRSAPYGSEHLFLHSAIGCSPCYRRRCPGLNTLCMVDIPPEAVVHRVRAVLEKEEPV